MGGFRNIYREGEQHVTDEDSFEKISSTMNDLKEKSREVEALIEKLEQKKKEIMSLVEAVRTSTGQENGSNGSRIDRKKLLEAVNRNLEGSMISTGNQKLDSLLFGGITPPSNIVLRGPPFSGKFVIANNFIAQSIRDGIPVVVFTADKDIVQIKESLSRIVDNVEEAEASGLIRFIDAYSRSIQEQARSKYAVQADSTNLSSLIKTVDAVTAEVRGKNEKYRFVLTSLTSFITQHEERTFLRLLQQFSQKRKSEGSVAFYILEDGLFDERMYEAVSYMMDGAIHLRKTFSDNYIRVEGIGKTRSREWIELYASDSGYDLGSFTLERVR